MNISDSDFEIVCRTHPMKFTEEKYRANNPFYFIDVLQSDGFYGTETIFSSKLIDVGEHDREHEPVFEIFYPYDKPVLIQLKWYNDTYSGILDERAVEKSGWVRLTAEDDGPNEAEARSFEDSYERSLRRDRYLKLTDDVFFNIDQVREAFRAGKLPPKDVISAFENWSLEAKFQRP